jgi:hypothetical protein
MKFGQISKALFCLCNRLWVKQTLTCPIVHALTSLHERNVFYVIYFKAIKYFKYFYMATFELCGLEKSHMAAVKW